MYTCVVLFPGFFAVCMCHWKVRSSRLCLATLVS